MSDLGVNENKITAENAFNPDHLWMKGKHEYKKKKRHFQTYIQIYFFFSKGSIK